MKAAYLTKQTGPEGLAFGEVPQAQPGTDEVLVKVHAAAVTPSEFDWFPTFKTQNGAPRSFPVILGHEFSGVVDGVSGSESTLRVGDAVYGMNDWFSNGAQA